MTRNRKRLVRPTVLAGGGLATCCVVGGGAVFGINFARTLTGNNTIRTVGDLSFDKELAIPPLAESSVDVEGRRTWDLTLQSGDTRILLNRDTATWGVNGTFLGPTLRARRGPSTNRRLPSGITLTRTAKPGSTSIAVSPTCSWSTMTRPIA